MNWFDELIAKGEHDPHWRTDPYNINAPNGWEKPRGADWLGFSCWVCYRRERRLCVADPRRCVPTSEASDGY